MFCFDNCCFGGFGFVCCCRWWMVGWLLFSIECFITCGFKVKGQNACVVTFEDPAKEQFLLTGGVENKGHNSFGPSTGWFLADHSLHSSCKRLLTAALLCVIVLENSV